MITYDQMKVPLNKEGVEILDGLIDACLNRDGRSVFEAMSMLFLHTCESVINNEPRGAEIVAKYVDTLDEMIHIAVHGDGPPN